MNRLPRRALVASAFIAASFSAAVCAKPIAFAHGTTVMAEYGAGTMRELQIFYAPRYFLSAGLAALAADQDRGKAPRKSFVPGARTEASPT